MKNSIKLFALAALLGLGGCHEPDELTPSVVDHLGAVRYRGI